MGHISASHDDPAEATLGLLDRRLLDDFQQTLPLVTRPYAAMGQQLGIGEDEVIARLRRLREDGLVSRIGPVFRPHAVGTSTLAAMAVPPERLLEVAQAVNAYPEVNHNYEREHTFNLWFVATAPDQAHLDAALADIERSTGLPVMSLPMQEAYHLDLGFRLQWGERDAGAGMHDGYRSRRHGGLGPARAGTELDAADRRLVAAVEQGLPLVSRPFAKVGESADMGEREVMDRLHAWLEDGIVNRFGVVVRHRRLGYRANAMVVWDIPDPRVAELGRCMGGYEFVTLCYQRPRRLPQWRYNLFCMIHGRDRDIVRQRVEWIVQRCGLEDIAHELLFSRRSFKQRGARYHTGSRPQARVEARAEPAAARP